MHTYTHPSTHTHAHTHTHARTHAHTHTGWQADISQPLWLWVFISLSFSFSSFIILLPLALSRPTPILSSLSFQPYCFSSPLHRSLILFLIQAHCFYFCLFLSHINPLWLAPSLSLRLAVFIFQSFISTNVRQCFCPPSIDPQRAKEMGRERKGKKGERNRQGMTQKDRCIEGGMGHMREWRSSRETGGMSWENGKKGRIKQDKRWRESLVFNLFSQITKKRKTNSDSPHLFFSISIPRCTSLLPVCLL